MMKLFSNAIPFGALRIGLALILAGVGLVAQAATVSVNNYNWLQLPATQVTTVFGSTNNATGSGYGDGTEPRWGDHTWIPDGTMTANGTQMYYAAVKLDQARAIENVQVQWWAAESTSVSRYYVDGSNDGSAWTNIGTHNFGVATTGTRFMQNVDVTDSTFQYVRVRLEPGDYAYGSASRGGPGIYAIEPVGDGTLNKSQVNWSNAPNFSTSVSNNGRASMARGTTMVTSLMTRELEPEITPATGIRATTPRSIWEQKGS